MKLNLGKVMNLVVALSVVVINNSCTFYYKTSDINKSLFDLVKAVNSNYKSIDNGFKKIDQEYNKLKSNDKNEPFLTAKNKMIALEKELSVIASLKKDINNEYAEFKNYSKGINKIASNSEEWGMVKQTKKNMKYLNNEISKNGEKLVKNSHEFNDYINENILPLVKIYKVSDYKERFTKTIDNLKKLRSENLKLLNDHRLIYNDLEKKHSKLNSEECMQLKTQLMEVSKKVKELENIEKAINDMYQLFIEKTKGQNEIYNTDPFWNILQQDQEVFKQHINSTKKVQENIKTDYRQFQQLANKLNAK
jgi:hypothetical protein